MHRIIIFTITLLLAACSMTPEPSTSLKEAYVVEGPSIIQRGSNYFLRYRRSTSPTNYTLILPVAYKQVGDTGCFYFYGPVSGFYYGQLVEYPLAYEEGANELAKAGRIYWLDPDGTKVKIPIRRED